MSNVAKQWLDNTRAGIDRIEQTQTPSIRKAAEAMADTIQAERWVHTFGCGHATIPIEDMYPRIGGVVRVHPACGLPPTLLTPRLGERWVHTFGCGHATIPIEDMYPRIGGFVGFPPMCELPLTFFTRIVGEGGVHQFIFLERVEGYGIQLDRTPCR